jgi:hypothetical protein
VHEHSDGIEDFAICFMGTKRIVGKEANSMPDDSRRIHFIERDDRFVPLGNSVYESGFWNVAEDTAASLNGGMIYFHERQDAPSFYGGRIIDYRVQQEGEYAGRIIFIFTYMAECRGFMAGRNGWGQEKKLVGL